MDSIPTALPSFVSTEHLGIFPSISAFFFPLFFLFHSFFLNIKMACCPWGQSDGEGSGLWVFLFLASSCKPWGCQKLGAAGWYPPALLLSPPGSQLLLSVSPG